MTDKVYFTPIFFRFLSDLKRHNDRDWFNAHKEQYENDVKRPAMDFISEFAPALEKISKHFVADPQKSMFRIYRDTRFSKDKSPYKTHVGIQFRHEKGKDAHAPGYYLHLEPGQVFVGLGIWRPDGAAVAKIRSAIVEDPGAWEKASQGKKFAEVFRLDGESLKRPPKGHDPDHIHIKDLMRKDFIAAAEFSEQTANHPDFLKVFTEYCRAGTPFVKFLCTALEVPF